MGDLFSRLGNSDGPPASTPSTEPPDVEITIAMEMHDEDVGIHAVKLSEIGSRQRPKTVLLEKRKIKDHGDWRHSERTQAGRYCNAGINGEAAGLV